MQYITIGPGDLAGKGVYAARDFMEGDVVIPYRLTPLSEGEFEKLPEEEKQFTHTHYGQIYLYGEPERYVNHSPTPNTYQDLERKCDVALRDIWAGEQITTDSTRDGV